MDTTTSKQKHAFIVSLYSAGSRLAQDNLPSFYATRAAAKRDARAELKRVASVQEPHPQFDWAARYTIRKVYYPSRLAQYLAR